MVTLPATFTCLAATDAKLSRTDRTSFLFISVSEAMASARPPLDKALPAAAFMPFTAFIAFGAMAARRLARQGRVDGAEDEGL